MTKQEAISELTRAAELGPKTRLAEACRTLIAWEEQPHDCGTCKHAAQLAHEEPCMTCSFASCSFASDYPDKWKPKEVDNGKTN